MISYYMFGPNYQYTHILNTNFNEKPKLILQEIFIPPLIQARFIGYK